MTADSDAPKTIEVHAQDTLDATLRAFAREADFPDYFGNNLDALLDCLRDEPDLHVVLLDAHVLKRADPDGYRGLRAVLRQAGSESEGFAFTIKR